MDMIEKLKGGQFVEENPFKSFNMDGNVFANSA